MGAESEREMMIGVSGDVECLRVVEHSFVAVGRCVDHRHLVAQRRLICHRVRCQQARCAGSSAAGWPSARSLRRPWVVKRDRRAASATGPDVAEGPAIRPTAWSGWCRCRRSPTARRSDRNRYRSSASRRTPCRATGRSDRLVEVRCGVWQRNAMPYMAMSMLDEPRSSAAAISGILPSAVAFGHSVNGRPIFTR